MIKEGTRERENFYLNRPETRFPNGKDTRDVGLSKRLTISATFAGSLISDAASNFTVFEVNDQVIIWGSTSNNGVRTILSISTQSITVDWPVATEGPTSNVEIRST